MYLYIYIDGNAIRKGEKRHYHSVNEVLDVVLCEGRGLAGTRHAVECVLPPGRAHPLTRRSAPLFIHRVQEG